MRFLIFNLLVLSSLAYLVTAPPGMSPTKWAREFPGKLKNSIDVHAKEHLSDKTSFDDDIMQNMTQKLNDVSKVASKTGLTVIEKSKDIARLDPPVAAKMSPEDIEKLIKDTVAQTMNEASLKERHARESSEKEEVFVPMKTVKAEQNGMSKTSVKARQAKPLDTVDTNKSSEKSDAELEAAFNEMMVKPVNAPADEPVMSQIDKQTSEPQFMTTGQRQSYLAQVMQDMELFYLERVTR